MIPACIINSDGALLGGVSVDLGSLTYISSSSPFPPGDAAGSDLAGGITSTLGESQGRCNGV